MACTVQPEAIAQACRVPNVLISSSTYGKGIKPNGPNVATLVPESTGE